MILANYRLFAIRSLYNRLTLLSFHFSSHLGWKHLNSTKTSSFGKKLHQWIILQAFKFKDAIKDCLATNHSVFSLRHPTGIDDYSRKLFFNTI